MAPFSKTIIVKYYLGFLGHSLSLLGFCIIFFMYSCTVQNKPVNPEIAAYVQAYKKVAVLPFTVSFSEDYKRIQRSRVKSWDEEARLAGLDLQRSLFEYCTERGNKKDWSVSFLDFIQTNKKLAAAKVHISDIPSLDKSKLARNLEVDAILYGSSVMVYDLTGFRKGMETAVEMIDAKSGKIIWSEQYFEEINNRMTSPKDLAHSSLRSIVKGLPFSPEP
jgi:hypothetical protein